MGAAFSFWSLLQAASYGISNTAMTRRKGNSHLALTRKYPSQTHVSPKDIYRNHWSRLATPEEVKAGLEVLEEYEWLTVNKINTRGRPSEIITLNPHLKL
jgi:hypothetical protein